MKAIYKIPNQRMEFRDVKSIDEISSLLENALPAKITFDVNHDFAMYYDDNFQAKCLPFNFFITLKQPISICGPVVFIRIKAGTYDEIDDVTDKDISFVQSILDSSAWNHVGSPYG